MSYGSDGGDVDRMGPIGDIAVGGRPVATPRSWGDYPMVREDAEVSIASRPRTRAMTAEQEKWVQDLTTHPVLSQASIGGLSTPREPREPSSYLLANQSPWISAAREEALWTGPLVRPPSPGASLQRLGQDVEKAGMAMGVIFSGAIT